MDSLTDYTRFAIALFAILDPFAAVPVYLSLTAGSGVEACGAAARNAALTAFAALVVAALSGELVLTLLGTSLDALRVGGGLVLLLMAVDMLNARPRPPGEPPERILAAASRAAAGVVPLGLPLLAGPAAISATIIQMQRGHGIGHGLTVIGCIALVCGLVWVILSLAGPIGGRLGAGGLNVLNRLFGLLLAAVAVQIMANGLVGLLPGLAAP